MSGVDSPGIWSSACEVQPVIYRAPTLERRGSGVNYSDDEMKRDLSKDWCPEGISLNEARAAMTLNDHQRFALAFGTDIDDESRAAANLYAFTRLLPALEDANGLQGAVDLTLHGSANGVEIVEVTSTIDGSYQRNRAQSVALAEKMSELYTGATSWVLSFEHGWSLPRNADLPALASTLASALMDLDTAGTGDEPLKIATGIHAYLTERGLAPSVSASSWNANIPPSTPAPYLNLLSEYLIGSDLIATKLSKLQRESERLQASRRHLYLLMASTGKDGGLLPVSPSYFTWGEFTCPPPVTDLWLDGGNGMIFHWNDHDDWVFHRTSTKD